MARNFLSDEEKLLISDLYKQGKTVNEISKITGFKYHFCYKWADADMYRIKNKIYQRDAIAREHKPKKKKYKPKVIKYPEREMPPINPPGEIKVIHADSEQIERHLRETLGDKLSPVVCSLGERKPPMNFISQDQLS